MLFHTFRSQGERRAFGGSDFMELQYCRLPPGTAMEEIVSADAIENWKSDSLYVHGGEAERFLEVYGATVTGGVYSSGARGPVDVCGINFYTQAQAAQIMERLEAEQPPEYRTLLGWLRAGSRYVGFYILGE